ncbi:MAG: NADH-quinone oxidoreductase subunit J [Peptococcaceae bacterium]|nr:NADH-quinone oxidoreductase subunit J [Peptococcaceae bacterium]
MISPVLFYLMAFVVIFGALMMVVNKNILYSAISMVICFLGVAGIFATMQLSFFAVVQIMVYVGAITILIVFAIMLTRHPKGDLETTNPFSKNVVGAGVVAVGLAFAMSVIIRGLNMLEPQPIAEDLMQQVGIAMFGTYVLPVELVAVLLLVGMLGAIVIGKEDDGQ